MLINDNKNPSRLALTPVIKQENYNFKIYAALIHQFTIKRIKMKNIIPSVVRQP